MTPLPPATPPEAPTPPVAAVPMPPPPPPAPLRARNIRLAALILASLLLLTVVYVTLPVVVAQRLNDGYPTVRAIITGVQADQTVRAGQAVTFSARQSVGSHLTYRWSFGDGAVASGASVTRTFAHFDAQLHVTLTVSDPLGATTPAGHRAQARITIHVMPPPPVAHFSASEIPLQVGQDSFAVNFDANGSTGEGITSYGWDCGDGATYASDNPRLTHFYSQTGAFTVTLTVTDSAGQTATARQTVVVTSAVTT